MATGNSSKSDQVRKLREDRAERRDAESKAASKRDDQLAALKAAAPKEPH